MSRKQDFTDPNLKTPAHDAIMIWLHENAASVVDQVFGIQAMIERANNAVLDAMALDGMAPVAGKVQELLAPHEISANCVWEHPVKFSGRDCYIDMLIDVVARFPYAELNEREELVTPSDATYSWQKTLVTKREPVAILRPVEFRLACEVKPVIRSVGELIRQLRQYESYHKPIIDSLVAVVSPDDRFKAIIESQGFAFIKAPIPDIGPQRGLI